MAALDTFQSFNSGLTERDRQRIQDLMRTKAAELLAARSEDARKRIVEGYLDEVHIVTNKRQ
ncbi:MAG: hypothetical protein ACKVRP_01340 [Bacteroidota bacterium]